MVVPNSVPFAKTSSMEKGLILTGQALCGYDGGARSKAEGVSPAK